MRELMIISVKGSFYLIAAVANLESIYLLIVRKEMVIVQTFNWNKSA